MDRLLKLVRGFPGHPAHPPLTHLTVGIYTFAAILGVIGAFGGLKELAGRAVFVAGGLVLTLLGFAVVVAGGWLGGTLVFVHGVRVLSPPDEPTRRAIRPGGESQENPANVGRRAREETLS